MTKKPGLFLGSSKEGLSCAEVMHAHLARDFEVHRWDQGLFVPGHFTLESLEEIAGHCTFAVIVGTADDVLTKRRTTNRTIRDNLVFEFGLFVGHFGRKRAILVTPKRVALILPSDLDGLTRVTYSRHKGSPTSKAWLASLQAASADVSKALLKELAADRAQRARQRRSKLQERRREAALRLYRAVTQLHDLFIELPTNALRAIGQKEKFDKVKSEASQKVRRLEADWHRDAELLDVVPQLDALAAATSKALLAFPYPAVHVSAEEAKEMAMRVIEQAKNRGTLLQRAGAATEQVEHEVERKVTEFANMYKNWWDEHATLLRERAAAVQMAVMHAIAG